MERKIWWKIIVLYHHFYSLKSFFYLWHILYTTEYFLVPSPMKFLTLQLIQDFVEFQILWNIKVCLLFVYLSPFCQNEYSTYRVWTLTSSNTCLHSLQMKAKLGISRKWFRLTFCLQTQHWDGCIGLRYHMQTQHPVAYLGLNSSIPVPIWFI